MTDRKVTVNVADLRAVLTAPGTEIKEPEVRLRAALDALGTDPCGHPSVDDEWHPIHCGDEHMPPSTPWADS